MKSFQTSDKKIEVEKGSNNGLWLKDSEGNLKFVTGSNLQKILEEEEN